MSRGVPGSVAPQRGGVSPRAGWRVFPWDPGAKPGGPFSAEHVPPFQGHGRFDLPDVPDGVLYLAELPEHALAEKLQDLRNRDLDPEDLEEGGRRYALTSTELPASVFERIADLCDPETVAALGVPPDDVAAIARDVTQAIAVRLHAEGWAGLRWWSVFFGEWHNLVIFRDRLDAPPVWSAPAPVQEDDAVLAETARQLGIRLP